MEALQCNVELADNQNCEIRITCHVNLLNIKVAITWKLLKNSIFYTKMIGAKNA